MKKSVLLYLCISMSLYSQTENPFARVPEYQVTPCNAYDIKYRDYSCVVLNDVADDMVHFLNIGYNCYYSY